MSSSFSNKVIFYLYRLKPVNYVCKKSSIRDVKLGFEKVSNEIMKFYRVLSQNIVIVTTRIVSCCFFFDLLKWKCQ